MKENKNKTMPSLRITESTLRHIQRALEKYNKENMVKLSQNEFRRLAYELYAQSILQDIKLPIQLQM